MADQAHPQEKRDRLIIDELIGGEANDKNLCELGRLLIRYRNFPGARSLQKDLKFTLEKWQLTEEELYQKTRKIHKDGKVYRNKSDSNENSEDWS